MKKEQKRARNIRYVMTALVGIIMLGGIILVGWLENPANGMIIPAWGWAVIALAVLVAGLLNLLEREIVQEYKELEAKYARAKAESNLEQMRRIEKRAALLEEVHKELFVEE